MRPEEKYFENFYRTTLHLKQRLFMNHVFHEIKFVFKSRSAFTEVIAVKTYDDGVKYGHVIGVVAVKS